MEPKLSENYRDKESVSITNPELVLAHISFSLSFCLVDALHIYAPFKFIVSFYFFPLCEFRVTNSHLLVQCSIITYSPNSLLAIFPSATTTTSFTGQGKIISPISPVKLASYLFWYFLFLLSLINLSKYA